MQKTPEMVWVGVLCDAKEVTLALEIVPLEKKHLEDTTH
jgi:hypothetical protein